MPLQQVLLGRRLSEVYFVALRETLFPRRLGEATDREAMVIDPSAQSERGRRAGQGKDNVRVGIHRFRGRYVFLGRICPGTQNAESNGQGEVDEGIAHCRLQHWIVTSQSDSLDRTQCDLAMGAYTAFLDLDARTRQPGARLVASGAGLGTVFLVSMLVRALRRG
jgi:hypothetical protein